MAGTSPDFDATAFRDGIEFAQTMGQPDDVAERPTFYEEVVLTSVGVPTDQSGVPFNPDTAVTRTQPAGVQVPCSVEYLDSSGQPARGLGTVQPSQIKVTVLDEFYPQIQDAAYVDIGGDRYWRRREEPQVGLFDVTVHQLHFAADAET